MRLTVMPAHGEAGRSERKLVVFALAAVMLAAMAWYAHNHVSIEKIAYQESLIRGHIARNPWVSFLVGFSVYSGLALVPGTGGKAMVFGWLFGFWQALTIVTTGLAAAAMAIFSLSRYIFRERIEQRYPVFLSLMNRHIEREGAFYLLTLRMAHAPYSIVNPVSGASRVRTWTFFWTTVAGLLPANAVWVYVGMRLPSLGELANRGPKAFVDFPLIVALTALPLLPLLLRWLTGRFRAESIREQGRTRVSGPDGEEP